MKIPFKKQLKSLFYKILKKSLNSAIKEQGLEKYIEQLKEIVPDITDQYTTSVEMPALCPKKKFGGVSRVRGEGG